MLRADGLTKRFDTRIAVEDVSFDVAGGEVLGVLGPNGAGKTTTLRMLAGLIAPTRGAVTLGGETLTPASAGRLRGRVGFLTESPGLWDTLTVRENLTVVARLYALPDPRAAVDAVLDAMAIASRADDTAARLSKGLRQRVAIARALVHQPSVVLLDEPTAGLDPASARAVRQLLDTLRARGAAVVFCSHNLGEVEQVSDRIAVLDGRVVALDTAARLRAAAGPPVVRIVLDHDAAAWGPVLIRAGVADVETDGRELRIGVHYGQPQVSTLVRLLVEAGAAVTSVTHDAPSLEASYLTLLGARPS